MKRTLGLVLVSACASAPLSVDRSELKLSDNTLIVARDIVSAEKFPSAVNHLALAEEVYGRELHLLRERRDQVRERSRALDATAFASLALTTLAVGGVAIASAGSTADAPVHLRAAGIGALSGLALGTIVKVAGFMQEDAASVDFKTRQLQAAHAAMIERVRELSLLPAGPGIDAQISAAIEQFMGEAMQVNVKG